MFDNLNNSMYPLGGIKLKIKNNKEFRATYKLNNMLPNDQWNNWEKFKKKFKKYWNNCKQNDLSKSAGHSESIFKRDEFQVLSEDIWALKYFK